MVSLGIFGTNVILALAVALIGRAFPPLPVPLGSPNESWILPAAMTLGPAILCAWLWGTCGGDNLTVMGRCQRPARGPLKRCYSHDDPITLHDALGLVWIVTAVIMGMHFLGPLLGSFRQSLG